ncbi:hypothetical protein ABPG75_002423 [Micractinium tetrahymenae]
MLLMQAGMLCSIWPAASACSVSPLGMRGLHTLCALSHRASRRCQSPCPLCFCAPSREAHPDHQQAVRGTHRRRLAGERRARRRRALPGSAAHSGSRSGRRMLFIGDSYTAGMGNTRPPHCRRSDIARFTDGLQAYGPLAAQQNGADCQLVAWSGAGLNHYRQWFRQQWPEELRRAASPRMRDLLHASDALNLNSTYNLSSWVPQIIVMAAGTNDFQGYNLTAEGHVRPEPFALPTLQQWGDEYLAFMQELRATFPQAAIVQLVWPLEVQLVGVRTVPQTAIYLQYMGRAFTRLQQAGLDNNHFLQLDGDAVNTTAFCMAHPDAGTHRDVARQLVEFIDSVLPLFGRPSRQQEHS